MKALRMVVAAVAVLGSSVAAGGGEEAFARERAVMVREIVALARETGAETGRSRLAAPVLAALERVPRHRFVPAREAASAYRNRPLPIGHGQTISQPYIVAIMTELLDPKPEHVVLEVGTGSGYQAAILGELVRAVYTIEIIEPLGREARERLERLGRGNVAVRIGDGYHGWPEHAPYDGILVTAAASHVPPPLVRQLKPGGRMVIPVGPPFMVQQLVLVEKGADGSVATRQLMPVSFVPLGGGH